MAISGRFEADFSDFARGVRDADVTLKGFEANSNKVESALSRMTESFSGTRVIQEATLAAEAVERIGGTSKLTQNELARIGVVASEAADKMQRMGIDVPPGIQKLTTAATGATNAFGTFRGSLSQVDRGLASVGINIGPQVAALGELAAVAGKTASQIGLVATGGAVLATFMAAWGIGRKAAEFFDLDTKVANAASSLFGFGDAAEEVAGHKLDILARATKIAGTEITDYDQALKIIKDSHEKFAETVNTSAHRVAMWNSEIAKVKAAGHLDALKADLEAQNSTQAELSEQYGISTRALEHLERQMKASDDALKKQAEETKKAQAAMDQYTDSVRKMTEAHEGSVAKLANKLFGFDDIDRARLYMEAIGSVENVTLLSAEAQEELAKVMQTGVEKLIAAGGATDELSSKMVAFQLAATKVSREASASFERIRAEAAATAALMQSVGLTITGGAQPLNARGIVTFDEQGKMQGGGGSQFVKGSGVTVFSPAPAATRSVSSSLGAGGNTNVQVDMNVSGVFDARSKEELQRAVSDGMTNSILRGSKVAS